MDTPLKSRLISLLFFLSCAAPVWSQTAIDKVHNGVILKVAPLTLFDVYNTLTVGAEIPFRHRQLTFQQEFGYGHTDLSLWYLNYSEDRPDRHHFRARSQLRYYVKEWKKNRIYFAGEYFLRRSINNQTRWVNQYDYQSGNYAYSREYTYKTENIVNAVHAKFGAQFWPSDRVGIEIYFGLGLRKTFIKSLTPDVNISWEDNYDAFWEPEHFGFHGPVPSLASGFQLCFRLGK
ncbi:hypothetical protein GCM10023091_37800 [Ravibacter arvi]|uniref:DUF3575 domain-containing protein n=1 Tax=Ravibacter arvi TaxID=2051041 RepID=A0ABP8M7A3_9BACT